MEVSKSGGFGSWSLLLWIGVLPTTSAFAQVAVHSDTQWRATSNYPATGWNDASFVEPAGAGWTNAAGEGFNIWYGSTSSASSPGQAWVRHDFNLTRPVDRAIANLSFDDDGEAYLNGHLILADTGGGATAFSKVSIPAAWFNVGANAVAMHGINTIYPQNSVNFNVDVTMTPNPSPGPVTIRSNVALNQSTTDALQGKTGVLNVGSTANTGTVNTLTNATAADSPDGDSDNVYFEDTSGGRTTVTYDLGAAGASTRQLDSVSLWLSSKDPFRNDHGGGIAVSSDNVVFTTVASDALTVFTNTGGTDNIVYSFAPGEVTNFRYLQLIDDAVTQGEGLNEQFGTGPYHARLVELDAFVSAVPEPSILGWMTLTVSGLLARGRRIRLI